MFVDVVGKFNRRAIRAATAFSGRKHPALALNSKLGKGSNDENPSHHGFGFLRVQLAGAGWMHLPMRRWADATALQQHPRYRAALHGDMRPGRAFNRPNQSAEYPATGHNILPTGPDLRPVWKLPLATGLPIILNSALMSQPLTKERLSC